MAGKGATALRGDELKWQTEEDLRALRRVAEIRKDKARLSRARKLITEEKASLDAAAKA